MLRWVYTDELEFGDDDVFLTELMKLANRFQLQLLRERQVLPELVTCLRSPPPVVVVAAELGLCAKLC